MVVLPNRDRRAERRDATRQEILGAAWDIAHQRGIGAITLREVAARVGMRPPSLYSHLESKNALYDAMFAQGWSDWIAALDAADSPTEPRRALLAGAETFFGFAAADVARYQLMNQRTVPDYSPSDAAYAASLEAYDRMRARMRAVGVAEQEDLDLFTAMLNGFVGQHLANDPAGDRWRRQLPRLVDMYCDEVGLPGPRLRRKR